MIPLDPITTVAIQAGAPVVGATSVDLLPNDHEGIFGILGSAKSVIVLAAPHNRSAIASKNNQVAQFDTRHCYDASARASHEVALWLEEMGHKAIAVPAFIPIDMSPGKNGMQGVIDWREAGVQAGIGGLGKSGLLVTEKYGPAVRIGGVVTDVEIKGTATPIPNPCKEECQLCLDSCPVNALQGEGKVNKKACGDNVFQGGFRAWCGFLDDIVTQDSKKRTETLRSQRSLELWQNFMTGIYYYCWACQSSCPVGRS